MKKTFILEDLDCAHCAGKIEEAVAKLSDVNSCSVVFMTQKMIVDIADNKIASVKDEIRKIVKKIEPDVTLKEK